MSNDVLDRIRRELDAMRTRVDALRVQANLGKMELRDALDELRGTLEPAYEKAKRTAEEVVATGARESQAVAKSLLAGWEEVRRTYREQAERAKGD